MSNQPAWAFAGRDLVAWGNAMAGHPNTLRPAVEAFYRKLHRVAHDRCDGTLAELARSLEQLLAATREGRS